MKQKRLLIMRHGETEWNVTARLTSTTDLSLNEQGRQAIMAMQSAFSGVTIDRILVSPLERAHETARLLSLSLPIEIDKRLEEVNFDPFEGKAPQELAEGPLAEAFTLWRKEPDPVIPEGAGYFFDAAKRAQSFMNDIASYNGTTLLVSHGVFLRVLLCQCVLGMPPTYYRRLRLDNGKISEVTWEGDLMRLSRLNVTSLL